LKLMDISIIDISMRQKTPDVQLLESFGRLRRALNLYYTQTVKPLGIGVKQAALIRLLAKEGTASLAELSRWTLTDPAATTRAVNVLLQRRLVRREEHPVDKRRWEMALTPRGKKQAGKVQDAYREVARRVAITLTPAERQEFHQILLKLTGVFEPEDAKGKNKPPETE
jgi:DNA-binding MarR family transcriptional regulator